MRAIVMDGLTPIELGKMDTLPLVGDCVAFKILTPFEEKDWQQRRITIGSRTFEQRPSTLTEDHVLLDTPPSPEWVCVLRAKRG